MKLELNSDEIIQIVVDKIKKQYNTHNVSAPNGFKDGALSLEVLPLGGVFKDDAPVLQNETLKSLSDLPDLSPEWGNHV